jgi:serine/threonine protein kinase
MTGGHAELIFDLAVAMVVVVLAPLALPLLGLARDAVRLGLPAPQRGAEESSQPDVERSVRGRLYGPRLQVAATPIPRPARLPRLIAGRYRLLEQVGAGGTASVHRARDELLQRDVAVKLVAERSALDSSPVGRLRSEALVCTRLAHPNILAILDAGDEPREFIVMELIDGLDAGRLLHRRGSLSPSQTVHVVTRVCEALAHAHEHGVVHGDVSPRNILIRRSDGAVKLADFGLASVARDADAGPALDITGTPGYVAPEILRGAGPSPRSDLYSLGVVAYRLLAGPPRGRSGDSGATRPLASAAPALPPLADVRPELARGLVDAVEQAMAHDPGARQDSVTEFASQLIDRRSAPVPLRRARNSPIPADWLGSPRREAA